MTNCYCHHLPKLSCRCHTQLQQNGSSMENLSLLGLCLDKGVSRALGRHSSLYSFRMAAPACFCWQGQPFCDRVVGIPFCSGPRAPRRRPQCWAGVGTALSSTLPPLSSALQMCRKSKISSRVFLI